MKVYIFVRTNDVALMNYSVFKAFLVILRHVDFIFRALLGTSTGSLDIIEEKTQMFVQ